MSSRIDFDSSAFDRVFAERLSSLKRNAEREEQRLADQTATQMRSTVRRLTGETAASIHTIHGSHGTEIRIGGAALFLEFGTSKMSPKPFARPALAQAPHNFRVPSWH